MLDEEISPEKHTHKAAEAATSKAAAAAAANAGTKTSGPLTMPVPKTDLSAGQFPVYLRGKDTQAFILLYVPSKAAQTLQQFLRW